MKRAFRADSRPYSLPAVSAEHIQPPALNDIPSQALRQMQSEGLSRRFPISEEQEAMVNQQIRQVWSVADLYLPLLSFPVAGVFSFNMAECKGDFKQVDGICCNQTSPTGEKLSLIGLDISAIEQGGKYVAFLLLHELAHATGTGDHSPHYHAFLDNLIAAYNHIYGTDIQNDYSSFNEED